VHTAYKLTTDSAKTEPKTKTTVNFVKPKPNEKPQFFSAKQNRKPNFCQLHTPRIDVKKRKSITEA